MIHCNPIWSYLFKFDPIWTNLIKFDQVWSSLIKFDQVWTNLIYFEPIWSISIKSIYFDPTKNVIFTYYSNTAWIFTSAVTFMTRYKRAYVLRSRTAGNAIVSTDISWISPNSPLQNKKDRKCLTIFYFMEDDIGKEKRNISEIFIRQITNLQTFSDKKITKQEKTAASETVYLNIVINLSWNYFFKLFLRNS